MFSQKSKYVSACVALVYLVVGHLSLYAQETGTINGSIKSVSDSSIVAEAKVVLYKKIGTGSDWTTEKIVETTTTNGTYAFANVSVEGETKYLVFAFADGYAAAVHKWIELTAGEVKTVDVYLGLPEDGFCTITGTVKNQSSEPVADAAITLMGKAEKGGSVLYEIMTVVTNSNGEYSFVTIPVMEMAELIATASGYVSDTANDFELTGDSTVTVDFVLNEETTDIITTSGHKIERIALKAGIIKNGTLWIKLTGIKVPADLTMYSINGKKITAITLNTGQETVEISPKTGKQMLIIVVRSENQIVNKKVWLP